MAGAVAILGGAGDGIVGVTAVMAAGFEPLVVDLNPHPSAPHVLADVEDEDIHAALAGHAPLGGAIICPEFAHARPDLLDRWLEAVLRTVAPTGIIIGIAASDAAHGSPADQEAAELSGDRGVVQRLRALQSRPATGVRSCLVLHDKLAAAFHDCRGETHEMETRSGELERAHLVDAIRFALSLPSEVVVRQLILEAPTSARGSVAETSLDHHQPLAARQRPELEDA
jgi:hypothetical protein